MDIHEKLISLIIEHESAMTKDYTSAVASEVQDIAIAFATYKNDHINDVKQGFASNKTDDELFSDFIEQYNK